jgi:hypothetical protein
MSSFPKDPNLSPENKALLESIPAKDCSQTIRDLPVLSQEEKESFRAYMQAANETGNSAAKYASKVEAFLNSPHLLNSHFLDEDPRYFAAHTLELLPENPDKTGNHNL